MNTRVFLAAALAAAAGAGVTGASAQPQVFAAASGQPVVVTFSLTLLKVNATNFQLAANQETPIGPGEAARFDLIASYGVDTGAPVTFPSSILAGSSGSGLLQGFWSGAMDILGDSGAASAEGVWDVLGGQINGRGVRFPYDAGVGQGASGTPVENGARLKNVQPAIFTPSVEGVPSGNPTSVMWRGVWIPADYSARTVSFVPVMNSLGLWPVLVAVRDSNGLTLPVAANAQADFGAGVSFQVVPGPASLTVLGLAALAGVSRRRPARGLRRGDRPTHGVQR